MIKSGIENIPNSKGSIAEIDEPLVSLTSNAGKTIETRLRIIITLEKIKTVVERMSFFGFSISWINY